MEEILFEPGNLAGGRIVVSASSGGGDSRWILPGPRELDPAIFGTPDMPLGFEDDVGVPLGARMTNEEGTEYTTTAGPTPFSDSFKKVDGSFMMEVVDRTVFDTLDSKDQVDFEAQFTNPAGSQYVLTVNKVVPVGPAHPFLGGVGTNFPQHGATGIGTKLMPLVTSYVAFWGVGELSVDGEVVASNRLVHAMLSDHVRDNENYELGFDEDVNHNAAHVHVILPNVEVTPDGPQESPVPTGFELPNGQMQPFIHMMFEDIMVDPVLYVAPGGEVVEYQWQPNQRVGGPVEVGASSSGEDARWILPGPREFDPAIFGTPDMPLGFEDDVGVPLGARMTNDEGTEYTTTAGPTPFSDSFAEITGSFTMRALDVTVFDTPDSQDEIEFEATFTAPDGTPYTLMVNRVTPVGPAHPFLGGVGLNFPQHGMTGIGTKLMPLVHSYVAFWGVGELVRDGEVVSSNRLVHAMLSTDVRDENYELVFDAGVDKGDYHMHVILPNVEVTPDGPQQSPVPTGFELPNGNDQPFIHLMFEEVTFDPAQIVSTK